MEGRYAVLYRGESVGMAEVIRQGLYYRIICRCRIRDSRIHRLYAGSEKIGVLIPEGESLAMECKVAVSRIKGDCLFSLDEEPQEFIPIQIGEEFSYLDKIRLSKLTFQEGNPGMILNR